MPEQNNETLIKLIKQGIDTQDNYEKLYKQNRGFIFQTIRRRVHGIYECDDLMQQAFFALAKAVNYFNCDLEETNFLQILKYSIWNELRDLTGELPAHMQYKIMAYRRTYDKLYNELGYKPKAYQIMLKMDISLNELDTIRAAMRQPLSLDEPINEEGDVTRMDLYADEAASEDDLESIIDNLDNINLREILGEALSKLPERAQEVIEKRYYKNMTLDQCGHEMNVSKERVRQIESKGFRQLRKDYILKRKVNGYFNEVDGYRHVGLHEFNKIHTSAVELAVIKRENFTEKEQVIISWLK